MAITLSAAVGPNDSPLPITGGPVPAPFVPPCICQLDNEQVLVFLNGATSLLVVRGYNGTAQQAHASGAVLVPESLGVVGYPLLAPAGFLAETMVRNEC